MQGRTHLLAGIFIGILFFSLTDSFFLQLVLFSFAIIGSLFPDIDLQTSKLGRKFKLAGYLFTHRGFFHSTLILLLLSIILGEFFSYLIALAFFSGFFSHLLLDALTKRGLYIWPFKKKLSGPFIVGGFLEKMLQLLLLLALVFLLVR